MDEPPEWFGKALAIILTLIGLGLAMAHIIVTM